MFPARMKSSRRIKFGPNFMDSPRFTVPDSRRRPPPKGILKKNDRNTAAVAVEPPVAGVSKNLVLGQVKILKRGEVLNESSRILKEVNNSNDFTGREASKDVINCERSLPAKKQTKKKEKEKKMLICSNSEIDDALSSTNRMGPDIEIVSKQMKKMTECFAGSVLCDSPPPSSVPFPGFLRSLLSS